MLEYLLKTQNFRFFLILIPVNKKMFEQKKEQKIKNNRRNRE